METHARIERAVHEIHQLGLMPVCVGGGHDLTLPSINALARHAGKRVGGISLDAHLDVRPEAGSGMAFRHLIETKRLDPRRFAVVGVGRFVNEPDHLQWLTNQGARLVFADSVLVSGLPLKRLMADLAKANSAFVSIDLDVIDSASAPGVSALNPLGLSAPDAASLAEAAGAAPHVRHFDLMELNPAQDASGRTARLAALLFLSFLTGFGRRRA
jgi:formiminoglutamase